MFYVSAVEFSFDEVSYTTNEGGEVTVVVKRAGEASETLCIQINSRDGTAVGKQAGYECV